MSVSAAKPPVPHRLVSESEPFNEQDLVEAFDIATGATPQTPERRHLVALMRAWDEALDLFRIVTHPDARGTASGDVRADSLTTIGRLRPGKDS